MGRLKNCYDIVIAGAGTGTGTGGCGAAIQAARMGRSVLLLEETDWIGGQMNVATVTSMEDGKLLLDFHGENQSPTSPDDLLPADGLVAEAKPAER